MTITKPKLQRILAVAPQSRGVGYAVFEGDGRFVDWGIKTVGAEKNSDSLKKIDELLAHYTPSVLILEDAVSGGTRRSLRIQTLSREVVALTTGRGVSTKILSRNKVRRAFISSGLGTKQDVAEVLARRFPRELGPRLPPPRKPWVSEHYQMGIFDAVALAVAYQLRRQISRGRRATTNGEPVI